MSADEARSPDKRRAVPVTSPPGSTQCGPRRLLMVTTVPGTLTGFLLPYARHFRERGWEVDAATGAGSQVGTTISGEFTRVWELPWSRTLATTGNLRALPRMRKILAVGRYDLVHVHTPIASLVTRLAAAIMGSGRPAIAYTAHGFHFYEGGNPVQNFIYAAAERLGGTWTDRLIVINAEDARQALARKLVPASRLAQVPGVGIDLDFYAPTVDLRDQAARLRDRLGIPRAATVYTMIAGFQPGKNHTAAVKAFSLIEDRDSHLILAGIGPLQDQVQRQVDSFGLRSRVHFLGFVTDIRPLVLTSDATLLPSQREGLSRAVLESLSLGVPVIGGNCRGIRELVDDDVGILVEPDDVEGIKRALTEICSFPTHGRLRDRCRSRLASYSLDHLLQLHGDLYEELLCARRPAWRATSSTSGAPDR